MVHGLPYRVGTAWVNELGIETGSPSPKPDAPLTKPPLFPLIAFSVRLLYIYQGFGGMMSIEFGTQQAAIKFAESTKIFKCAVSLGGAESLIEHVRTMTHGDWVMSQKVCLSN